MKRILFGKLFDLPHQYKNPTGIHNHSVNIIGILHFYISNSSDIPLPFNENGIKASEFFFMIYFRAKHFPWDW